MEKQTSHILDRDIEAFEAQEDDLKEHYLGKFVVFHQGALFGAFDTLDNAAKSAIEKLGKGPFLIRQVGRDRSYALPASVAYRQVYAAR